MRYSIQWLLTAKPLSTPFTAFVAGFAGITLELEDTRKDCSETRMICYRNLAGRMLVVGHTPRGTDRHAPRI